MNAVQKLNKDILTALWESGCKEMRCSTTEGFVNILFKHKGEWYAMQALPLSDYIRENMEDVANQKYVLEIDDLTKKLREACEKANGVISLLDYGVSPE